MMRKGQSARSITFDPAAVVESYPAPIARAYAEVDESTSPLDRLFALKDLFEVALKYCAIVMIQDYLRLELRAAPVDSAIVQYLPRPQLGNWNHILREIARCCQSERERVLAPELVDFYFETGGTPRKRGHELVDKLISFRNRVLAHRARPRAHEAEQIFQATLPLIEEFLSDLGFLKDYPLIYRTDSSRCETHMGAGSAAAAPLPESASGPPGRLYVQARGVIVALYPLLLYERCGHATDSGVCELTKFFFFNGGERKPEFLDYSMSHVKQVSGVGALLQEIVSACRDRLNLDIGRMTYAVSADLMGEMVRGFVGRTREEDDILGYISTHDRGFVTVIGDPGIGKSALLSRIVFDLTERGEAEGRSIEIADACAQLQQAGLAVAYHVCTRRVPESTAVPQILGSLAEQLVKQYGPATGLPRERSLPALLDVARVAHASFSSKALLVIDGVDEILSGRPHLEQSEILHSLPVKGHLPEGVFVLLSSRRGYLDQEPGELHQLELHGLTREDVLRMLDEAGNGHRIEGAHVDAIQRVSENNALYVRMLVNDLKRGDLTLDRIDRLPAGLEGYFEEFAKRLSVDPSWPVLRDCLLLLAVARSHLSVNQVLAMTGLPWAEVQEALEDKLQPVLVAVSPEIRDYQLFHEKFREFLLALFSGKLPVEVASRLNRHFVREAPRELHAEGEVSAPAHLTRARERLLDYCRRWREPDDDYPLRHLPRHLYEAGEGAELEELLLRTDFAQEKIARIEDPFPLTEDFRYLALSFLETGSGSKLVELAVTENAYQRDGVASALRVAGPDRETMIAGIVRSLLARSNPRPSRPAQIWSRLLSYPAGQRPLPPSILNARRVALDVAYSQELGELLVHASQDRSQAVRTLLVPYLYRYWHRGREAGWQLLDRFNDKMLRFGGLPNGRTIECYGSMCLAILIYHSDEAAAMARLHAHWKRNVRRILHLPEKAGRLRTLLLGSALRVVIFLLTRMLKLLMSAQPDFQPINLLELAASYSHPGTEQQLGLKAVECLEHPERGFSEAIDMLLDREVPFGVYLMMVLERTLVFHGAREQDLVMRALYRVHRDGCEWFRQSALYVAFHTLNRADSVDDELLDLYAQMTRETIRTTRARFQTGRATYELMPHMAWAEIVFDKHRPQGQARFIPEFYREARSAGDAEYARRAIGACVILSTGYRRHELALDALRVALDEHDPMLRTAVAEALCNIRFHAEGAVDRFLESENAKELARLTAGITPTLKSNDIMGWIDDYMNYAMIHSEYFRAEIVGAFRRAGHARGLSELLRQVLKWVINLSVGEELLTLKNSGGR